MGNHTIARQMFVHEPGVLLYAPLRTTIHEDADGVAWFTVDLPSSRFGSFGDPAVTASAVTSTRRSRPCWSTSARR